MVCKGINANGKGIDGFSLWLPVLAPASSTSARCVHSSYETKTHLAHTLLKEQGDTRNSIVMVLR